MHKFNVIGTSGSGKSSFSKKLAAKYNLKHIELDSIFWLENWEKNDDASFRAELYSQMDSAPNGWVIDNFVGERQGKRPFTEADAIVFLDTPIWLCLLRVLTRGTKRIVTREKLWGKCQEGPMNLINLLRLMIKWNPGLKKMVYAMTEDSKYSNQEILIFKTNSAADDWLSSQKD